MRSIAVVSGFTYNVNPARILFGLGASANVAAEVSSLGCSRALVLSTPFQASDAERLAANLGPVAVGVFTQAAMHTPVDVTENAMAAFEAANADCVIAVGGGSTIGLGKAIAYRNDAPQVVIATTYAGSEVTPILGQTENGLKTTVRHAKILPEVVIYDPELTLGLPVAMSVTSGLNAMAHAVEAVYAENRNPVTSLMAVEGVRALRDALPGIVENPESIEARSEALYGAWLCGAVLGTVGMALHHKICHTLGGTFDLPHADTHAIMLPHSAAYNAPAAKGEMQPLTDLFGSSIGGGLWDFAKSLGAPMALRELNVRDVDLDHATEIATRNPYWNPRPIESQAIRELLQQAFEGRRPE